MKQINFPEKDYSVCWKSIPPPQTGLDIRKKKAIIRYVKTENSSGSGAIPYWR